MVLTHFMHPIGLFFWLLMKAKYGDIIPSSLDRLLGMIIMLAADLNSLRSKTTSWHLSLALA